MTHALNVAIFRKLRGQSGSRPISAATPTEPGREVARLHGLSSTSSGIPPLDSGQQAVVPVVLHGALSASGHSRVVLPAPPRGNEADPHGLGKSRYATGPYELCVIAGVSHWIPDEAPAELAAIFHARAKG